MKKTLPLLIFMVVFVCLTALMLKSPITAAYAKDLEPCKVNVSIIETVYAGKEVVCFSPVFKIYNPNNQGLHMDKFNYELNVGDFYFAGQQIPVSFYIPSKTEASFAGALPASWAGMSLWLMQIKGISMGEGMKEVIPLWKKWGGKLFNPKLKEAWENAEAQCPPFTFNGNYEVRVDEKEASYPFETSWSME